mmetsp:Transcript_6025/g.9047  ORF Transcript_6025/g.9047 Transcript_6025/m.9047 type:complete len:84 (+) Transcript_6025:1231-1482(+)
MAEFFDRSSIRAIKSRMNSLLCCPATVTSLHSGTGFYIPLDSIFCVQTFIILQKYTKKNEMNNNGPTQNQNKKFYVYYKNKNV